MIKDNIWHTPTTDVDPEPPMEQEFTEIKLSKCCLSEVHEYWIEGKSICMGCWRLNPEISETLYQCSLCLEESEDEECNCYTK